MKIIHIITSLGDGGAENTLYKICKYDIFNEHVVISLKKSGKYFSLLNKLGVKVYCLNLKFYSFHKFFILLNILQHLKPDIVQTWLVHADLIGGIAAKLVGVKRIIWNIRYSNFKIRKVKKLTIILLKFLSILSFWIPQLIIIVSKNAKKIFKEKGYDVKKLKFIPNGYDLSILKPDKVQKKNFCKKIKVKKYIPIIGNVARYDPKKDHSNLIRALSIIRSKKISFVCYLFGSNINKKNTELVSEIESLHLSKYIKLSNQNNNISEVMNGLDIYIQSSSYGEGFPNVVAEAMACGTPSIVTNVGDASFIVGKTGWVVPPNNPKKLATAIEKALFEFGTKKWKKRSIKARLRIQKNFQISKMLKSYNKLWYQVYNNS